MKTNFDKVIDRTVVHTEKWGDKRQKAVLGRDHLLPTWVADMDFKTAPQIIDALVYRSEHGVFGYEYKSESFKQSFIDWMSRRHSWPIEKEAVHFAPSVSTIISVMIDLLTEEDDQIIIQPPVYHAFAQIIKHSGRVPVKNSLQLIEGHYSIDYDDLSEKARDPKTKLLILANPHNPVGRVWTAEELERIAEIVIENDLMVISDEIHRDILRPGHKMTPISGLSEEMKERTITCLSPGKTFNISALSTAATVIYNEAIASEFEKFMNRYHLTTNNPHSIAAFEAAYREGEMWFDDFLDYYESNLAFVKTYLKDHLPMVDLIEPEGTYMIWLDLRQLNLNPKLLQKLIVEYGHVAFDFGHWFGREGAGFIRMGLAAPKATIKEVLNRLTYAIEKINSQDI